MTGAEFRDLVTVLYLEHGKFLSVKEIARISKVPEHKIRQASQDAHGRVADGLQRTRDMGSSHRYRYGPTLYHLRDLLNARNGATP